MSAIYSYNLQGLRENFADWIASITPEKTPFISMLGIDAAGGTDFKWQSDRGSFVDNFEAAEPAKEGDSSVSTTYDFNKGTEQYQNYTQIFRRVVKISDSALAFSTYGREDEQSYQLAKAAIDLKREIEYRLLSKQDKREGADNAGAMTAGFAAQCAPLTALVGGKFPTDKTHADPQTGAITSISTTDVKELTDDIMEEFSRNLFLAGGDCDTVMYNPHDTDFVNIFHHMDEGTATMPTRLRLTITKPNEYGGETDIMTWTDSMGQTFKIIPNRWMPRDCIYFFNKANWDMVVFREPEPKELDTDGSYQTWLVECEVGLRHAYPAASGLIQVLPKAP